MPKPSEKVIEAIKTLKIKAPVKAKSTKTKPVKQKKAKKVKKVIKEYLTKKLKSSNGKVVTNPKQALAIALSSAKKVH